MVDYTNGGVRPDWARKEAPDQQAEQTVTKKSEERQASIPDGDGGAPYHQKNAYKVDDNAEVEKAPDWIKKKDNEQTNTSQGNQQYLVGDEGADYHNNPSRVENTHIPPEIPLWVAMKNFDTSIGNEDYLAGNLTGGPVTIPAALEVSPQEPANTPQLNTAPGLTLNQI
jgi:hypothetical protein